MFEQSMMNGRKPRAWTFSVSTGIQLGMIGAALLVPLLKVEALPPARLGCDCRIPRGAPVRIVSVSPEPQPGAGAQLVVAARPRTVAVFVAPTSIPKGIPQFVDEVPVLAGGPSLPADHCGGAVPDGFSVGTGGFSSPLVVEPPPRPTKPTPVAAPKPDPVLVRPGGKVRPPQLIHEVRPSYPPLARQARVQGTVRIEAVPGATARYNRCTP